MNFLIASIISILSFIPANFNKQEVKDTVSDKLIIGITPTAPFVRKEANDFTGLSISSWKLVNQRLGMDYEFKVYPSLTELIDAIENKEVDFSINPITVTDQRMNTLDFSQPYFISHTGIAQKSETHIWRYLRNILSWNFLSAIIILLSIIFFFGFLVWIFEHRKNEEQFGKGVKGIFQGFWWSAVTMTTVGYGDKAPLSLGGRIVGFIWMFMAIILISSLTAGIASSLTVQNISDEIMSVQDLERFDVITVSNSSAQELLDLYNIRSEKVADVKKGMQEVIDSKFTLFVYDEPILRYEIERRGLNRKLEVLQRTLKRDYYSYSFPKNSPWLEIIDPALIASLKSMEWNQLVKEYR